MENAYKTGEAFRKDFVLTAQNFIIGITFLEYCKHKNSVTPGFTDVRHRAMAYFFMSLVSLPELPYKELMELIKNGIDPVVYGKISRELRLLRSNTVNQVLDFGQRLREYLREITQTQPTSVCRVSVVGRFLRKISLVLNVSDFNHSCLFSKYLLRYLDGGIEVESRDESSIRKLYTSLQDISINVKASDSAKPDPQSRAMTTWGKARAISYVHAQAEKFRDCAGAIKKPKELQRDLEEILAENPDFTDVHYLTFLNELFFGEYSGALESCHRFFLSSGRKCAHKFRFALLNLAMLYRRFHHFAQAEIALKECINLCLECGDIETLGEASKWLKSMDLSETTLTPENLPGKYSEPHSLYYMRFVNQLDHLPLSEDTPRESFERLSRKWQDKAKDPASLISENMEQALFWVGYGFHKYAQLHCEIILHLCHMKVSPLQKDTPIENESTILALTLHSRFAMAEYRDMMALEFLQIAVSMISRNGNLADMVDLGTYSLACEKALREERYELMYDLIDSLSLISPSVAEVFRARMCFQRADYGRALKILDKCDSQPDGTPLHLIRGLWRTRILLEVGSDQVVNCILKHLAECERFHLGYLSAMFKLELVRYQSRIGCSFNVTIPTIRTVGSIILSQGLYEDRLHFHKVMTELTQDTLASIERMTIVYEEWRLKNDIYNQRCALDFLARKCHEYGDIERRNIFCKLFRKLVSDKLK